MLVTNPRIESLKTNNNTPVAAPKAVNRATGDLSRMVAMERIVAIMKMITRTTWR